MAMVRKAGWFVVVAVMMAGWMGVLGSVRGVAEAGVIASSIGDAGSRVADMAKVQAFLENKVVVQKLIDYGVSPAEAMAKVKTMDAQDLHRLASLTDRAAAGADGGVLWFLISLAVLVILVLVILKLMNKEVIVR
ncbi:MAG: PA2779 family protein [Desulfobacteria bacterium]